eukprot:1184484-Prorocentrum_minimum.AAC.1
MLTVSTPSFKVAVAAACAGQVAGSRPALSEVRRRLEAIDVDIENIEKEATSSHQVADVLSLLYTRPAANDADPTTRKPRPMCVRTITYLVHT